MTEYTITFAAPDDWRPMSNPACWTCCPFACLTELGGVCRARQAYSKEGLVICPVFTKAKKEQ